MVPTQASVVAALCEGISQTCECGVCLASGRAGALSLGMLQVLNMEKNELQASLAEQKRKMERLEADFKELEKTATAMRVCMHPYLLFGCIQVVVACLRLHRVPADGAHIMLYTPAPNAQDCLIKN